MSTNPLEDAVARHYANQQATLLPPLEPHPGFATLTDAILAHRRWLDAHYPPGAPPPVALPDPPPEE